MLYRKNLAKLSDATSRQDDYMLGRGGLEDDDDDDGTGANDDVSAIGEVKDIRLSLFQTENGTQLFAKQPGGGVHTGGSRI